MEIKVLFDSLALNQNYKTGWGLSCLIDGKIIFDTGENGEWLLQNIKKLNVDLNKIKVVVFSHNHWDHTGGIWALLEQRPGLDIYAGADFSEEFKQKVKQLNGKLYIINKMTELSQNIFITNSIAGEYEKATILERAIVIKTENGISVITGCAHPGIVKILEHIKTDFSGDNFYLVMGGFHLLHQPRQICEQIVAQFKKFKVQFAGPTHCSGQGPITMFKQAYEQNFVEIKVGQIINV
jgi:7,8-dihydropterin-6-yl-methyl-4-(beta-D-ribofuranosyl)aminobenzene 5'-phosphate synthase